MRGLRLGWVDVLLAFGCVTDDLGWGDFEFGRALVLGFCLVCSLLQVCESGI